MNEQRKPSFGAGYKHGYIFGRLSTPSNTVSVKSLMNYRRTDQSRRWGYWNTPLSHYCAIKGLDIEIFLEEKAREAKERGRNLRILDVGIGSGEQWRNILERIPNLKLIGTTLSPKSVAPGLRLKVVLSTAATLHKKFDPGHFDVVFTNFGLHGMKFTGIENIVHVLKKGGHAIITGDSTGQKLIGGVDSQVERPQFYSVIAKMTRTPSDVWSYHLQKN